MFTLNCKGKILVADKPLVMGIINITPDSFYKESRHIDEAGILAVAGKMLQDGADILDIGGQSTRPGSERITVEEEIKRVVTAIETILKQFPDAILSVDTFQSKVAEEAVKSGAVIINDISSGELDKEMIPLVASLRVPYICMHMKGTPATMQETPVYNNVTREVLDYFIKKIEECQRSGINDIIVDPGFGFGKTIQHNFTLLNDLGVFKILGKPIMAGLSRKSTIYKTLGITASEALNGTTVMNTLALKNGAEILRVHDVKEAVEVIQLSVFSSH